MVATRNPILLYDMGALTREVDIRETKKLKAIKEMRLSTETFRLYAETEEEDVRQSLVEMVAKMQSNDLRAWLKRPKVVQEMFAKKDEAAMRKSTHSRAMPTFRCVCFFRIRATLSVPPEEAWAWKSRADPMAVRIMA